MINHKFDLDKSFQNILYRIDNWINEGSGVIKDQLTSKITIKNVFFWCHIRHINPVKKNTSRKNYGKR